MQAKLTIEGLRCQFGQFVALDRVDLQIQEGEFVCVLGASGCGKSTLFNAVSGLLKPSEGRILLDGKDISNKPGQVGYMLQKDMLLPSRSVLGNIVLGASLTRGANKADYAQAQELAVRYGLGDFLHHYPKALSGGMRQRVAMMRTVAAGKSVMLLDEPFGALDAQTRLSMQQWLLTLWQDLRRTIMFITHDVDEAIFLADRIVVMTPRPGRIALILNNPIQRPRTLESLTSASFIDLKRQIMGLLYGETAGAHAHD